MPIVLLTPDIDCRVPGNRCADGESDESVATPVSTPQRPRRGRSAGPPPPSPALSPTQTPGGISAAARNTQQRQLLEGAAAAAAAAPRQSSSPPRSGPARRGEPSAWSLLQDSERHRCAFRSVSNWLQHTPVPRLRPCCPSTSSRQPVHVCCLRWFQRFHPCHSACYAANAGINFRRSRAGRSVQRGQFAWLPRPAIKHSPKAPGSRTSSIQQKPCRRAACGLEAHPDSLQSSPA